MAEQRQALAASCEGYDRGNEWEAARLATAIFTLVHDGGLSIVSILTQLGVRGSLRFISSGHEVDRLNLAADHPLLVVSFTPGAKPKYVPRLGQAPVGGIRHSQFPTWWTKELVYRDGAFELTRRRLVFALRHQDGGGHVGTLTDESYVRFKTKAIWVTRMGTEPPEPMYGATSATMRQIAWELSQTLDDYGEIA